MGIEVDETNWPIIVINALGDSSDDDLQRYLRALQRALNRCESHVVMIDARGGKSLKGTHRKLVADWNKAHEGELREFRKGLVLVTESTVLRGMITAIYWIFPAPFPYHPVADFDEGWALCRRLLGK